MVIMIIGKREDSTTFRIQIHPGYLPRCGTTNQAKHSKNPSVCQLHLLPLLSFLLSLPASLFSFLIFLLCVIPTPISSLPSVPSLLSPPSAPACVPDCVPDLMLLLSELLDLISTSLGGYCQSAIPISSPASPFLLPFSFFFHFPILPLLTLRIDPSPTPPQNLQTSAHTCHRARNIAPVADMPPALCIPQLTRLQRSWNERPFGKCHSG